MFSGLSLRRSLLTKRYIEFNKDGTVFVQGSNAGFSGDYVINGNEMTVTLSNGRAFKVQIQDGTLIVEVEN